ncbi:hypothetical protein V8C37DRAFT_384145 [Trichoderma ceciliae]
MRESGMSSCGTRRPDSGDRKSGISPVPKPSQVHWRSWLQQYDEQLDESSGSFEIPLAAFGPTES